MAPTVTPQTVERIYGGHTNFQPIVQVLDVKKLQPNPGQSVGAERFRLVISDGTHYLQAMLATQLNHLIASNQIQPNGLLCLKEFICNEVQAKKIVIILSCDVISASAGFKIGEPVEYGKPAGAAAANPMMGGGAAPARPPQQAAAPLGTMAGAPMAYQPKAEAARAGPGSYQPGGGGAGAGMGGGGGGGYRQSAAPVVRQNVAAAFVPISELNPYQNRWTIKARVTNKGDIKRWSNAKGEGTLFSIDLLDEQGGEVRGAFFKEACEKFYPIIQQGKVYTFSGGRLKVAQRQYSSIRNEYEITFDTNSLIEEVQDEGKIQAAIYNFKKINEIEQVPPNATIDLLGVVKAFTPESTITTKKDGREVSKRELTIADDSGTEVRLTLWGEKATQDPAQWEGHPIVAFKGVKVSDFNGRSLGSLPSTQMQVQPDLPEAAALHNWWYTAGSTAAIASISAGGGGGGGGAASFDKRNVISQIKEEHLGFAEKPDYVEVKATVTYYRNDPEPWYKSCTSPDCKRKVTDQLGTFYCEKCQRSMTDCTYRYILSLSATDASGSTYITAFDDVASQVLGKTAEELNSFKQQDMQAAYESVFQAAQFESYVFRLRVKAENVNDEQRVKATAMSARPLNFAQESRDLVQAIKAFA